MKKETGEQVLELLQKYVTLKEKYIELFNDAENMYETINILKERLSEYETWEFHTNE